VVERVQETILDERWKPVFARYLIPKYTGLRLDPDLSLAVGDRLAGRTRVGP